VTVPRCLTVATSDSSGGAGIQADLRAFAAAGCYGASAIVALTAQSTVAIQAVVELEPEFITAELNAIFSDIGADAAKTGALISRRIVETVADFFEAHEMPLVVDPVLAASTGRPLLERDAIATLVARLFPLATVITPNLVEAETLTGRTGTPRDLAEALVQGGAKAVIITGGHSPSLVDHLYDGREHVEVPVARADGRASHGSGCTHSATLTAQLAKGASLVDAARTAAQVTAAAIAGGFAEIGAGTGPVDVTHVTRT